MRYLLVSLVCLAAILSGLAFYQGRVIHDLTGKGKACFDSGYRKSQLDATRFQAETNDDFYTETERKAYDSFKLPEYCR